LRGVGAHLEFGSDLQCLAAQYINSLVETAAVRNGQREVVGPGIKPHMLELGRPSGIGMVNVNRSVLVPAQRLQLHLTLTQPIVQVKGVRRVEIRSVERISPKGRVEARDGKSSVRIIGVIRVVRKRSNERAPEVGVAGAQGDGAQVEMGLASGWLGILIVGVVVCFLVRAGLCFFGFAADSRFGPDFVLLQCCDPAAARSPVFARALMAPSRASTPQETT